MEETKNTVQKQSVGYGSGVTVFLFAVAANLAAQLLIGIAAAIGKAATGNENFGGGDYFQLIAMIVLQIAFFAAPLVYFGCMKKVVPVLPYGVGKPSSRLALTPVIALLCICGFMLPALYFVSGLEKAGYTLAAGVTLNTAGKWVLAVFVMVLLAPCVEELIFRGFLLSGLRARFSPVTAALLSAAAFSLMHLNPEQTVYQFFLGLACALAVLRCGNVLAGVFMHASSNLFALLLETPIGGPVNRAVEAITRTWWGATLAAVLLAAACGIAMWFLIKLLGKPQAPQPSERVSSDAMGTALYIAGVVLCAVLWVFVLVAGFTSGGGV